MAIDLEKIIADNLAKSKNEFEGLGKKNKSFNLDRKSGDWSYELRVKDINGVEESLTGKNDMQIKEVYGWSMLDSTWLDAYDYDEETGILVIYFQPLKTNCKPPVVLGIMGGSIPPSFVKALEMGIYSYYHGYDNSPGAFYKKYIQQDYSFFDKKGVFQTVKNPYRVVDAVSMEDVNESLIKINKSTRIPQVYKDVLNLPGKKFFKQLSPESLEKEIKKYAMNKLKNAIETKTGKELNKQVAIEKVINKIIPWNIMNEVRGTQQALNVLGKGVAKKGVKAFDTGNRIALARNATGAAINEGSLIAAGVEMAPETMGISLAIAGMLGITAKMLKNQQGIQKTKKILGRDAISVFEVLAYKKIIKRELARHIRTVGIEVLKKEGFKTKAIDRGRFSFDDIRPQIEKQFKKWNNDIKTIDYSKK